MSHRVSVVGGGTISDEERAVALEVGRELGARGYTVVCGGRGGTMAAVCRGAKAEGGRTIGILPGEDRSAANEYVDTVVVTGLGHARNALVAMNGDAVLALSGGDGTLTEIGFAGIYDRPIVGIDTHAVPGVETADTPAAAVDAIDAALDRRH